MMMDQLLASLVTRERDDYFGRFFHSLGAGHTLFHCRQKKSRTQVDA
jgi:hypothetical protein